MKRLSLQQITLILLALMMLGFCIGFLFLNNKLNRQYHGLSDQNTGLSDQYGSLSEMITEAVAPEGVQTWEYDFNCIYHFVERQYDPNSYYIDWATSLLKDFDKDYLFDENGVMQLEVNEQRVYNPTGIAQYALKLYGNYIYTDDPTYLEGAKTQAEYLLSIQDKDTGKFYYQYTWPLKLSNQELQAPWASAMAQGQAISLFSRLYHVTGERRYYDACVLAMEPLKKDIKQGGLTSDFFGYTFYEEYPTEKPIHVLNGHMFTLIGLLDFWKSTGNATAKTLYQQGMETLKYALPFYDNTGCSLYHLAYLNGDNLPLYYNTSYHTVHINQLYVLNQFEQDTRLQFYIDRWKSYVPEQ